MSGGICKDGLNLRRVSAGHHEQESRVVPSPGSFKVPFFPLSKFTPHKQGLFPRPCPLQRAVTVNWQYGRIPHPGSSY